MTPEAKVKQKVKEWLTEIGCYWFCPVQSGFGAKTLDFLCCHQGRFFAIETKALGKQPTKYQNLVANLMKDAGAKVYVIDSEHELDRVRRLIEFGEG